MINYIALSHKLNVPNLEARLKSKSRARRLVDIRRALSAILVGQGYSMREIAHELCRPHSTVIHFVQTHEHLFATDNDYHHLFHQLQDVIQWHP